MASDKANNIQPCLWVGGPSLTIFIFKFDTQFQFTVSGIMIDANAVLEIELMCGLLENE